MERASALDFKNAAARHLVIVMSYFVCLILITNIKTRRCQISAKMCNMKSNNVGPKK